MKLTERGADNLNSMVYLSRALISLTEVNSALRGMLTPAGGREMRSNVAFMSAEVIRDIQQYQNVPYSLQPVPELQDYITTNMQTAGDVHEMYDLSLQVEPREREEDKIARSAFFDR